MFRILPVLVLVLLVACDDGGQVGMTPVAAPVGMQRYTYVMADGGPHVFLPASLATSWKPVNFVDVANPKSLYNRAGAAVTGKDMALFEVGGGAAIVLADPPFSTCGTSSDGLVDIYSLHNFSTTNLDGLVDDASAAAITAKMTDTGERLTLEGDDAYLINPATN